ncbi:hypothetical protein Ahy_B08g090082 isoform B [Arachis hypogaea]|uniref:Uncharacterized protein n=1 Tax=Arachis hypogaea TaxID=3818 RepID=A0A444XZJ3_ARAHY|nr:hypothetical protein Ahy_B08g090082 isoform B [Arachis hypogaea]
MTIIGVPWAVETKPGLRALSGSISPTPISCGEEKKFELLVTCFLKLLYVVAENIEQHYIIRTEGPLDEKDATIGEGLYLVASLVARIVAVGFLPWKQDRFNNNNNNN